MDTDREKSVAFKLIGDVEEEELVEEEEEDEEWKFLDEGDEYGEHYEDEYGEYFGEYREKKKKTIKKVVTNEFGEEIIVEEAVEEQVKEEEKVQEKVEEVVEEEEYVEPPPPDPTEAYDITDSKEALRPPYELEPYQIAELEELWELFQNHTPVYSDINGYITEKELVYMLKSLILMTYTPEQLLELIIYYVKPPDPEGKITYEQFVKIVRHRQRDLPVEEELRNAMKVMDYDNTGSVDREHLKEVLAKKGYKMPPKQLIALIKEVDIANDGTIGVDDVVNTMCMDLNPEDIQLLRDSIKSLKHQIAGTVEPTGPAEDDDPDEG